MLLSVEGLNSAYGSLEVGRGEIVAVLGGNGAGKTTTLRTIAGLHAPAAGRILFDGEDVAGRPAHEISERGISLVPEGRQLFPEHSVEENLELGAYRMLRRRDRAEFGRALDEVFEIFPRIKERRRQKAGLLSGGEQQMVAIARALVARPRLLLMDEPSLGLAPILLRSIFKTFLELRERGLTLLLVEQMAWLALAVCDRGYVLESGSVTLSGSREQLLANPRVLEAYLGKPA